MRNHQVRTRGTIRALTRAAAAFLLLAALVACGATPTVAPEPDGWVQRAATSTTGVPITDTLPGPVMLAHMNDAGVIAFSTGSNAYVYDARDQSLTDLDTVAPCPASGPRNRALEPRKVTANGSVLYRCVDANGVYRSYVWDAETGTDAVLLPGGRTWAMDVNEAGTVVGWAIFDFQGYNQRQRGFVWNPGDAELTEILPLTATGFGITSAYSINELGQVLGSTPRDPDGRAVYFIREPSGVTVVVPDIEVGVTGNMEEARINDLGEVAAIDFRRFASPQERRVFHRAANGAITDLGIGALRGFNDSGTVLVSGPDGMFTWSASTQVFTPVEVAGGSSTSAAALNEAGQVLLVTILDGDVRSLVWDPATRALTELGVPADVTPATRAEARAFNDAGLVVGQYLNHPTFIGLVWQLPTGPDEPPPADPPTADAGGPYAVVAGNAVVLDGTGSSDPAGAALTYEWDLDHDGVTFAPDATGATVPLATTADDAGRTISVALRVTNAEGLSDVATADVTVIGVDQALTFLIDDVRALADAGVLNRGQAIGLSRQLVNARRSYTNDPTSPAACDQVRAFVGGVDDLVDDGALPEADADVLRADAGAIGSAIGCEVGGG